MPATAAAGDGDVGLGELDEPELEAFTAALFWSTAASSSRFPSRPIEIARF
jgi:hypothetical protein